MKELIAKIKEVRKNDIQETHTQDEILKLYREVYSQLFTFIVNNSKPEEADDLLTILEFDSYLRFNAGIKRGRQQDANKPLVTNTKTFEKRKSDFEKVCPEHLSHDETWEYCESAGGWHIPDFTADEELFDLYEDICNEINYR